MKWTLDKSRPMCPQICELICVAIAKGELTVGKKLPSVREIALDAGVNPNTVQKSLEELERSGIIHSVRCSGWFVNEEVDVATEKVKALKTSKTKEYIEAMSLLGCSYDEMLEYLNKCKEDKNE